MLSRWLWAIVLPAMVGCTSIRPTVPAERLDEPPAPFSHEMLDGVLARFVDEEGRVDYAALKADPKELDRYYSLIAAFSPDSHPDLFPTEADALAYWINAYNAATIKIVLRHYPISSVMDVKAPFVLFFLPDGAGFFLLQRIRLGGRTTSLYALENDVIRERFGDPRFHFALNCASGGCPRLPNHAFHADRLDEQLQRETVAFLREERNLRISHDQRVVRLSSICQWYRSDFTGWAAKVQGGPEADLLAALALLLPEPDASELRRAEGYEVRSIPYDWQLNDQAAPTGSQEPSGSRPLRVDRR